VFQGVFHLNIVVSDLDRAIDFYCGTLGMSMQENHPFETEGADLVDGFGMTQFPRVKIRGAFLRWGDNPNATCIDIVEFLEPKAVGAPYPTVYNLGICRTALKVTGDLDDVYQALSEKGVEFVSPPVITTLSGQSVRWCCFRDPDGTMLEIFTDRV
jgi:catechol 2,3-dioxygenase-like lactoylglutathione lyase family enzyme